MGDPVVSGGACIQIPIPIQLTASKYPQTRDQQRDGFIAHLGGALSFPLMSLLPISVCWSTSGRTQWCSLGNWIRRLLSHVIGIVFLCVADVRSRLGYDFIGSGGEKKTGNFPGHAFEI